MALRNPAVQLYNILNLDNMEKTDKKVKNSLLRKNINNDKQMFKKNEATRPLISVINHLSVIRNKRDEINETRSTTDI
jgi:hypothetical protein|tara:strand:+ start:623 stop:856 length:234 start_codon:yes stop_codon:yes gene_type:complete